MRTFWLKADSYWNGNRMLAWALVLLGMGLAVWSSFVPQSPGVSIGLLAGAAGIMSMRPKMHPAEKFAWVAVLVAFTVLEIIAIGRGDKAAEATREAQNRAFTAIADGLKTSIDASEGQYRSTISHLDGVLTQTEDVDALTKRTLENITGGDSYIATIPDVALSGDEITFSVTNRGKNILTGASVLITTQGVFWPGVRNQLMDAVSKRLDLPTLHPGERMVIGRSVHLLPDRPEDEIQRIYVLISGPNFTTEEFLEFKKTGKDQRGGDAWEYKYSIFRMLPYRPYRPGEKIRKDPLLERTEWTTENDPKFPIPKPKQVVHAP
jgi:hypothetical protein